ncbi:prephenate dehydrogenase [Raineyella sp. LH-20]|uniref:prephenate dehydrogenase n=1 Tax=Raineyella sp. LH-20 TaxID=3081204 RepID=UPI0029535FDA|nr:prephenate dehydrogenase [Raineyella sp. LH-20]WOP20109.1 prephenate dehydrogenase [Raineyella sp. LH-20]
MVGLIHPSDLAAWQRWQTRRRGVRGLIGQLRAARHPEPERFHLTAGSEHPRILIAVESLSSSQRAALLAPVHHLPLDEVAVLSPEPATRWLPDHPWREETITDPSADETLDSIATVLAAGHFLPRGAAAYDLASRRGLPFGVVQHGLLVPMAPPLPAGAHLLAWSAADGDFWRSGRTDVTVEVIGSQLFWEARVPEAEALSQERMITWAGRRPIYLGQLHGAEIGRRRMAGAAQRTVLRTTAIYRPHPQERDILSRSIHRWWQRRGITIDRDGGPLPQVEAPVVGVFSTGILEAAARGIPAWVDFGRPPRWLIEFWDRYGMHRLGEAPTPPPPEPDRPPALAVGDWLRHSAG